MTIKNTNFVMSVNISVLVFMPKKPVNKAFSALLCILGSAV
jgi:hypothetical protein